VSNYDYENMSQISEPGDDPVKLLSQYGPATGSNRINVGRGPNATGIGASLMVNP
jgi:hypothetical protein